jgi:hypothetical protein
MVFSSQTAAADFAKFHPEHAAKAVVLTFATNPIPPSPTTDVDAPPRFLPRLQSVLETQKSSPGFCRAAVVASAVACGRWCFARGNSMTYATVLTPIRFGPPLLG